MTKYFAVNEVRDQVMLSLADYIILIVVICKIIVLFQCQSGTIGDALVCLCVCACLCVCVCDLVAS